MREPAHTSASLAVVSVEMTPARFSSEMSVPPLASQGHDDALLLARQDQADPGADPVGRTVGAQDEHEQHGDQREGTATEQCRLRERRRHRDAGDDHHRTDDGERAHRRHLQQREREDAGGGSARIDPALREGPHL